MRFPRPTRARVAILVAFVLALGFTAVHVVRMIQDAIFWNEHRDEPIADWMTIGFVAHAYHVPPHVLLIALGLPPGPPPDRRTLAQIAAARGQSVAQVAAVLNDAIAHVRPPYPPPGPPPAPPAPEPGR